MYWFWSRTLRCVSTMTCCVFVKKSIMCGKCWPFAGQSGWHVFRCNREGTHQILPPRDSGYMQHVPPVFARCHQRHGARWVSMSSLSFFCTTHQHRCFFCFLQAFWHIFDQFSTPSVAWAMSWMKTSTQSTRHATRGFSIFSLNWRRYGVIVVFICCVLFRTECFNFRLVAWTWPQKVFQNLRQARGILSFFLICLRDNTRMKPLSFHPMYSSWHFQTSKNFKLTQASFRFIELQRVHWIIRWSSRRTHGGLNSWRLRTNKLSPKKLTFSFFLSFSTTRE